MTEPTARRDAACMRCGHDAETHEPQCVGVSVATDDNNTKPCPCAQYVAPPTDRDAAVDAVMRLVENYGRTCAEQLDPTYSRAAVRAAVEQYGREQRIAVLEAMPCALRLPDEWVAMVAKGDCLSGKARVDAPCPRCAELERQRGAAR